MPDLTSKIDIQGGQKSKASLDKVAKGLKNVAGEADNWKQVISTVHPILNLMSSNTVTLVAGLGALATATMAIKAGFQLAIETGRRFVATVEDLVERGGRIAPIAGAFERFVPPEALDRLREATSGLVDGATLMSRFVEAIEPGIVGEEEIIRMFGIATQAAQEHGRDITQVLQSVTAAMAGGGMEGLLQIGVNVLEIRTELRRLGLTAESTEGRLEAVRLAMDQLSGNFTTASGEITNIADGFARLQNVMNDAWDEVGRGLVENENLVRVINSLGDIMDRLLSTIINETNANRDFHQAVEAVTAVLLQLGATLLRNVIPAATAFIEILAFFSPDPEVATRLNDLSISLRRLEDEARGAAGELDELAESLHNLDEAPIPPALTVSRRFRPAGAGIGDVAAPARDEPAVGDPGREEFIRFREEAARFEEDAERRSRRREELAGGQLARETAAAEREAERLRREAEREARRGRGAGARAAAERMRALEQEAGAWQELKDLQLEAIDEEIAAAERLAEVYRGIKQDEEDRLQVQRDLAQVIKTKLREEQSAEQDRQAAMELQFQQTLATQTLQEEGIKQTQESAQWIGIGGQALGNVTDALGQHLSFREQEIKLQLQTGKITEDQAKRQWEALEKERKVIGGLKAAISFVEAAQEIARAIGSYPDVAGIVIHGLSAAAHITAGAMALSQLGGSASPPPGGKASANAATRTALSPERRQRGGEGTATAQIMLVSLSSAAMAKEMAKAERARQRIGMPAGMAGAGGRR